MASDVKMTTQISSRSPSCLGNKQCANGKSHFGLWFIRSTTEQRLKKPAALGLRAAPARLLN